ncbi:Universal stress protein [Coniochaeta hoffmannii]|uniref:Universal stress protein n=1 Tax=Coniochaeta hoffmannii TaxID=91930 RepID=A0AA38S157_9PEZI|nr:Universal stress protein [Coniochaeta hoffmannii]
MSRPPMSMEAMLDEERREVLALLEGPRRPRAGSSVGGRSPSPYTNTPRSPVRSMLDIAPVRSMLDVDSPPAAPVRSMLDVDSPPGGGPVKQVLSNPTSPIEPNFRARQVSHPRSMSDAAAKPVEFGPRASTSRLVDPTADYQFSGIITNHAGVALPKRVSQGGKRTQVASSVMAEVMRGNDVSTLALPGERGRHSVAGPTTRLTSKSKSPGTKPGLRNKSPQNKLLSGRHLSPAGRAVLNESQALDFQNAYRRLSDANLAFSGGSLSELSRRKKSDESAGYGRLEKDYLGPDGEELPDDSSDENGASSSEDEDNRGRKAARTFDSRGGGSDAGSKSPETTRQSLSLLAAAEAERLEVANRQPSYQYRSLLDDPEITVTNPSGEKVKTAKPWIHPATSFDLPPGSMPGTPMDSDTEADITDIKRAQKLSFSMTAIMNTPESHRAIRIITRGEYGKIVQEAEEEHRRLRKYLVATDLSEESTHALEWAIGTVLRDGDTLIAIYCVDEETGIVTGDGVLVPDEPKAMKDQAAALNALSNSKAPSTSGGTGTPLYHHKPSPLFRAVEGSSVSPSPVPSSRERSKAEEERYRAAVDITERVTKLLRKTRLQVRVIVEVLHCKNPKHLITEVIDIVNPTLVILGSRGRSALKGVILGSFSNYLVTKSSVPVMVARKRLRKQSKYKRPIHQQVNNISNPAARSLANAKID